MDGEHAPVFRLLDRRYWRVETSGIEHVPRVGAAPLVSNHAGVLPLDGAMIKTALFEEGVDRHARALIAGRFFSLPVLSWFLRRSGQTIGHPEDTVRLLGAGELVLVFPEGVKGTGKPFAERYQLRRFGRGGFVEVAIRAGAPIVPVSVVGSEEIYPMLADVRPLASSRLGGGRCGDGDGARRRGSRDRAARSGRRPDAAPLGVPGLSPSGPDVEDRPQDIGRQPQPRHKMLGRWPDRCQPSLLH